jgi:hypothetical protein
MCKVVHGGKLAAGSIDIWIIRTSKGEWLPTGRVIQGLRFIIIEANIINTVALFFVGALQPTKVLLRMAGDLHRCPGGDKVPGDVLPITAAIHAQTTKELPVATNIGEVRLNQLYNNLDLSHHNLQIGENKNQILALDHNLYPHTTCLIIVLIHKKMCHEF